MRSHLNLNRMGSEPSGSSPRGRPNPKQSDESRATFTLKGSLPEMRIPREFGLTGGSRDQRKLAILL